LVDAFSGDLLVSVWGMQKAPYARVCQGVTESW
jgi:hypothetical protein